MILAQALATITDKRGQIRIPEWRPDSLTPAVRAALDGLPIDSADGPAINADWGEEDLTPVERAYGWNSFAILAMKSGVPEAPVNAISAHARHLSVALCRGHRSRGHSARSAPSPGQAWV